MTDPTHVLREFTIVAYVNPFEIDDRLDALHGLFCPDVHGDSGEGCNAVVASCVPVTEPDDYWDDHDTFPVSDWQHEVAEGDTRLGYHAWRDRQLDDAEN